MTTPVEVRPVQSRADMRAFLALPERLYAQDPCWVPAIGFELRKHLNPKKNPFFEHGEAQLYVAWRGNRPVGRISAQVDRLHNERYSERTAFFGFFESEDDPAIAQALLDAARSWASHRGMNELRGPFNFSINHISGCLVDGFDTPPVIEMGHALPYYGALIEGAGCSKVKDLYAWNYDVSEDPPEMVQQLADAVAAHPGLTVREVDMAHFDRDLSIILTVFNEAWAQNWGFVPITPAEVKKMAEDLKLILDPRLAFIAEVDGEPAAISLTLPDINSLLLRHRRLPEPLRLARTIWDLKVAKDVDKARLMILGIRRKFRGSALGGLSVLLYCKTHWVGKRLGMKNAELGWTLEDNTRINQGIEMMGGKRYKTYRVYASPVAPVGPTRPD